MRLDRSPFRGDLVATCFDIRTISIKPNRYQIVDEVSLFNHTTTTTTTITTAAAAAATTRDT